MKKTLADIKKNETVIVTGIADSALRRRIIDLGITPGVTLSVEKRVIFGGPLVLKVRGYSLAVRRDDARLIEVII